MIRSLRKGATEVELWNKSSSVSVSAIETELELMSDHAIFRTKLKPISNYQRDDADQFLEKANFQLTKISIRDLLIRKTASKFLNAYNQIKFVRFEILYKKRHNFSGALKPLDNDGLVFMLDK